MYRGKVGGVYRFVVVVLLVEEMRDRVNGRIRLKMYGGQCRVRGKARFRRKVVYKCKSEGYERSSSSFSRRLSKPKDNTVCEEFRKTFQPDTGSDNSYRCRSAQYSSREEESLNQGDRKRGLL